MTKRDDKPEDAVKNAQIIEFPTMNFSDDMLEELNRRFAVVVIGGQTVVMDECAGDDGRRIDFLSLHGWRAKYGRRLVYYGDKKVPIGDIWIEHYDRRDYDAVFFKPGAEGVRGTGWRDPVTGKETQAYNLWRGWSVEPAPGDASPWFDHVHEVICGGDAELSNWVFGWFAHMFQRPQERPGTALVLRGGQGTGKTMVGNIIGQLFPHHYLLVDNPRYVVGQFNAHLANCLLLQADEGFWAGDKQAEGVIKSLITSRQQMIEKKGLDPIFIDNYVRLLATSNEDWVVPVGMHERRFCVIDVSPARMQDHEYFSRLWEHFQKPENKAALLYELLHFPLENVDVWTVPRTGALFDQFIATADVLTVWWYECLHRGALDEGDGWPEWAFTSDLYKRYLEFHDVRRIGKPVANSMFVRKLKSLCPGMEMAKRADGEGGRRKGYYLPPLDRARQQFEDAVGHLVRWD